MGPALDPPRFSLFQEAQHEANRFKWIESEKACHDLGEPAIHQWVKKHWWGYLRARWIEHLHGQRFWIELDRGDFGLLKKVFQDDVVLLDRIMDRVKSNQENLDVIVWAYDWGIDIERVIRILEAIDINGRRLSYGFGGPSP